ncbi:MAG: hypothetical protein FWE25_10710 [Lachnospiraceae bacterium]|nr:hypothetical protein [Lachnospiraceae bacterium]
MFVKKKMKFVWVLILVLLAGLLPGCMLIGGPQRQIQRQLSELDSTTKAYIIEWVEEVASVYFENIQIIKIANDVEGYRIHTSLLDGEERFVEWDFQFGDSESIILNFIYKRAEDFVSQSLEALDTTSLSDIMDWIELVEGMSDITVSYQSVDGDENVLSGGIIEEEDIFIEWSYEMEEGVYVDLTFVYDNTSSVMVGETFELGGLETTFEEEISFYMVEDSWSLDFGVVYFVVNVTMLNTTEQDMEVPFATLFLPNGSESTFFEPSGAWEIEAGESEEGFIYFEFDGFGDYLVVMSDGLFEVEVTIPITDINDSSLRNAQLIVDNDALLVGTWAWDEDDEYEYVFRADGTGTRGFGRSIARFEWFTRGDYLVIDEFLWGAEIWSFSIVGDVLTISSEQIWGLRYSYIRTDATPAEA